MGVFQSKLINVHPISMITVWNFFLQKTIDYLKIDIEGSEVDMFNALFETNILSKVKQLSMEIHPAMKVQGEALRTSYYRTWSVIRSLETLGFQQWLIDHNNDRMTARTLHPKMNGHYCCTNVHYINTKFMKDQNR